MIEWVLIALFGSFGVLIRALVDRQLPFVDFPWATLLVNIVGCAVAGVLYAAAERTGLSAPVRTALLVGFCGGLTTFSAYSLQIVQLLEKGRALPAVVYFAVSPALGFCVALLSVYMTKRLIFHA